MIVLPFNMAIIVHDSFVSISNKMRHTHSILFKKKKFVEFLKKQVFFTLNTLLCLPAAHLQLLPICLWKMPSPFLFLLLILQKTQSNTYILNTKEKVTF